MHKEYYATPMTFSADLVDDWRERM
jgi:hypothetical protein